MQPRFHHPRHNPNHDSTELSAATKLRPYLFTAFTPRRFEMFQVEHKQASVTQVPEIATKEERSVLLVRERRFERQGRVLGGRAAPSNKNAQCVGWIRMPVRGSLWLLPSGPDQIRNISSSEPIEHARRSVYSNRSPPARQARAWGGEAKSRAPCFEGAVWPQGFHTRHDLNRPARAASAVLRRPVSSAPDRRRARRPLPHSAGSRPPLRP